MKLGPIKFSIFLTILFLILVAITPLILAEITIQTKELEEDILVESIDKIYEITPAVLEKGYQITIQKNQAIRLEIQGEKYYLIIQDISNNQIFLIVPGNRKLILNLTQKGIIDINQNNQLDIEFILNKIENNHATITIQEFIEEKPIIGEYIQLFDVEISLINKIIYSPAELNVFIKFTNFGEGPSDVEIIYSVLDENNTEVYTGIDSKIIYTEDSIIKNFNFLEIVPGNYKILAKINYGNNQTAESEKSFELKKRPLFSILQGPLFFVLIIIAFFIFIRFSRKYYENKRLIKSAKQIFNKSKGEFVQE